MKRKSTKRHPLSASLGLEAGWHRRKPWFQQGFGLQGSFCHVHHQLPKPAPIFITLRWQSPLEGEVVLRGWVSRLRVLGRDFTFVVVKDCSGEAQCVASSDSLKELHLKSDDVIEIYGRVRSDDRAKAGFEVDVLQCRALNRSETKPPI